VLSCHLPHETEDEFLILVIEIVSSDIDKLEVLARLSDLDSILAIFEDLEFIPGFFVDFLPVDWDAKLLKQLQQHDGILEIVVHIVEEELIALDIGEFQ
jgi:GGDEF domain-containing protein